VKNLLKYLAGRRLVRFLPGGWLALLLLRFLRRRRAAPPT